ncbi:MAG: hypothetical protein QOG10_2165 [Kribbellaceae bacterium]|nr:hypothetical protein [Kribbellaceae bacterium]
MPSSAIQVISSRSKSRLGSRRTPSARRGSGFRTTSYRQGARACSRSQTWSAVSGTSGFSTDSGLNPVLPADQTWYRPFECSTSCGTFFR